MKRFIALMIMLLPLVAMAQTPDFSKLTKKYADNDQVTVMSFNQQQLMAFMDDEDDIEDIKNIDNITIVMTGDKALGEEIFKAASKIVKRAKAEEMLSTSDEEYSIRVYTTSESDIITSLIVSIVGGDESGVIIINGRIPSDMLNELVKVQSDKINL